MRGAVLALAVATGTAGPAPANDGFGGLTATGLTFARTDAVAMEEEDLYISPDRVRVSYLFRNLTAAPVTGEVIFPLPPIPVGQLLMSEWNLPEDLGRENLVDFTVVVDGRPVPFAIDRIAVIEPPWDEARPTAAAYDTPGRDVTAELARLGLPLSLDPERVAAALLSLSPEQRARAVDLGLAEYVEPEPDSGQEPEAWPLWSIVLRHHWTQTFPPGQAVRIDHAYRNLPPGGLFIWRYPPADDWLAEIVAAYCIDDATARAIARRLPPRPGEDYGMGGALNIAYVLRTANSWAGPIGRFRLTLDKGDARNVISLCAEGVRKTGPTTFVIERTDFVPQADLAVLVVTPWDD